MRNLARLGFAVILLAVLAAAAFAIGYRAGNCGDGDDPNSVMAENTDASDTQVTDVMPTATGIPSPQRPTPTATSLLIPTVDEPAPTDTPLPSPTPTEVNTATPSPIPSMTPEQSGSDTSDEDPMGLLDEVWQLLSQQYYGDLPSPEARTYGAIRGMLSTLDDFIQSKHLLISISLSRCRSRNRIH